MNLSDIANRIWYFRNKKELSARELSLMLGKSATYINQIESKNFTVSLPVLLDILRILDIQCSEFFADNYESYRQDTEIIELIGKLSEDRKKSFIDILRNVK